MSEKHSIYAFAGCLATIVILAICGTIVVGNGKSAEVYGLAITGLIGVIGTFRPKTGANVENADTVNQVKE
jgi:hypothetical protein